MTLYKKPPVPVLFTLLLTLIGCSSEGSNGEGQSIDGGNMEQPQTNSSPGAFNLLGIENNSTNVELFPSFSWNAAQDPDGDNVTYEFLLDFKENPTTVIVENLSSTSYTIQESLERCQTYYWQIIASDGQASRASEIFSFSTRNVDFTQPRTDALPNFPPRRRQSGAVFNNRLWIIAGQSPSADNDFSSEVNDVWSSEDGINWVEEIESGAFTDRSNHTTEVFNDRLWILAGQSEPLNEIEEQYIWSSADGISWNQEILVDKVFSRRFQHSSVVFDDKMWVIGGREYDGIFPNGEFKNDVWYTSDGVTWIEATSSAPFSPRQSHTSLVFDNKIWVIAGSNFGVGTFSDVWSSEDGAVWREESSNAFPVRFNHSSVVFDNKMWVFGGLGESGFENDIWYSSDGNEWKQAEGSLTAGLGDATALVKDGQIWIIAGTRDGGFTVNTVSFN